MRSITKTMMFIVTILLAAMAVTIFFQEQTERAPTHELDFEEVPEITTVALDTVVDGAAYSILLEIKGSEATINLSESIITIHTPRGQQDLRIVS